MTDKIEQIKCQCGHPKYTHNVFTGECEVRTCKCTLYSQEPQQVVCPKTTLCREYDGENRCKLGIYVDDVTCNGGISHFAATKCLNYVVQSETPDELLTDLNKLLLSPDLLELGINEHYWDSMPEGGERKIYAAIITNLSYAIPRILTKCHQSEAAKIEELQLILMSRHAQIKELELKIERLTESLREAVNHD